MKCLTPRCRNKTDGRKFCNTCRSRQSREKDPVKYCYTAARNNAKRRGKAFELTLDEFRAFCVKYDYLRGKGKTSESYSIDRIDSSRGYTVDNIQVITLSENSRKGAKVLSYDWATQYATVMTIKKNNLDNWDELLT